MSETKGLFYRALIGAAISFIIQYMFKGGDVSWGERTAPIAVLIVTILIAYEVFNLGRALGLILAKHLEGLNALVFYLAMFLTTCFINLFVFKAITISSFLGNVKWSCLLGLLGFILMRINPETRMEKGAREHREYEQWINSPQGMQAELNEINREIRELKYPEASEYAPRWFEEAISLYEKKLNALRERKREILKKMKDKGYR